MSSSWFSARLSDCRCFNDEKISCSRVWNRLALKSYRETQSKSVEVEPLDPVNVTVSLITKAHTSSIDTEVDF